MRPSRFFLSVPAMAMLAIVPLGGLALAATPLAQHRAVYDLILDSASDRSGIAGIAGRMVYEMRGSACDGYTVRFRYVTEADTREATQLTDQQTTTFEEANGASFSFATQIYTDQALEKELRGNATRREDSISVDIQQPEPRTVELPQALFPTQHLIDLIDKAKSGQTLYETTVFDGTDDADKVMLTTVVVGKAAQIERADPEREALEQLSDQEFWPVDIAYFDANPASGEATPEYRISFKLYENGLTRDLEMDYGDFVIRGTLVDLAIFETDRSCPSR